MKFTPNKNSWVGFATTLTGTLSSPKVADLTGAVDLTPLVTGITASTTGNALPTPTFDSDFNTSIQGNVDGTFSIDGYYDSVDASNLLWTTLPRGTVGTMFIARFVAAGNGSPPVVGGKLESWPVVVLSRSVPNMTSNTVTTITVTCAIPSEPAEDAVVVA